MQNLTFLTVVNQIKTRHGLKSDYAVCKMFGLSPQNFSNWRSGRSHPDEKMCGILAQAAGIDPLVLAASMQSQRSKTEEARSLWAMVAERLQGVPQALAAAFFAVLFATSFVATDAHAQGVQQLFSSVSASDSSIHRIYYRIYRGIARLAAWFKHLRSCFSPPRQTTHAAPRPQIAAVV